MLHACTEHIELDLYFVREKVQHKMVEVKNVPSSDQIADVLIKAISSTRFGSMRSKLKVESLSTLNLRVAVRNQIQLKGS